MLVTHKLPKVVGTQLRSSIGERKVLTIAGIRLIVVIAFLRDAFNGSEFALTQETGPPCDDRRVESHKRA